MGRGIYNDIWKIVNYGLGLFSDMIGCNNDLAKRHIPEIPIRNDTLAGPYQRRCDMVGCESAASSSTADSVEDDSFPLHV